MKAQLPRDLPHHGTPPISTLPGLTAQEESLHAALARPAILQAVSTVPDLLARWAADRPLSAALEEGGNVWTYRDLDADTRLLADHLAGAGIETGDRIALVMPRSAQLLIALLAILRAGAAFVPVGGAQGGGAGAGRSHPYLGRPNRRGPPAADRTGLAARSAFARDD
jgi:non-ribosomal peptide synthetase component F